MKTKRKIILTLTIVMACLFCMCFSACQDKGRAAEITSWIVGKTFRGTERSGGGYYEGETTRSYEFIFIDESNVQVNEVYKVNYDNTFFEGKLSNVYETSDYTRCYAIKAYKNGKKYIFIEGFGSNGKDTSNDEKGLLLYINDDYDYASIYYDDGLTISYYS